MSKDNKGKVEMTNEEIWSSEMHSNGSYHSKYSSRSCDETT